MQHRIRILLSFFCFFFQFFFLPIFMILLSCFCCCLILSFSSFFLSILLLLHHFQGCWLKCWPWTRDEVFLSCFPLGVSLGVYSDGDFSCFFKYSSKLSSVCVVLFSVCVDLLQVSGFTALA